MSALPRSTGAACARPTSPFELSVHTDPAALTDRMPALEAYLRQFEPLPLSMHPVWPLVLKSSFGHRIYVLEATQGGQSCGVLPLAFVRSVLFGRFLVSLPYVNYGGVVADSDAVADALIDRAVELAADLRVRYLELRHTEPREHAQLTQRLTTKVHMRLDLPGDVETLWRRLDAKVRNQVRKAQKLGLQVAWGRQELLPEFYNVFARNMRDLGTPVFGKKLFRAILDQFPDAAELCVVRLERKAVAAALVLHGWGVSEVPSASSLRAFNSTNANMLLYWRLLERATARGQSVFDLGRSTVDGSTFRFKKQWGALPTAACWQYHVCRGDIRAARPDNPRYGLMIRLWRRLPLALTRWLGPAIVRGIP